MEPVDFESRHPQGDNARHSGLTTKRGAFYGFENGAGQRDKGSGPTLLGLSHAQTVDHLEETSSRTRLMEEKSRRIFSVTRQFDEMEPKGKNGLPLSKLGPVWENINTEYDNNLRQSLDFVADGIHVMSFYSRHILPLGTSDRSEMLKCVTWFITNKLNGFNGKERAEKIANSFQALSRSVEAFKTQLIWHIRQALEYDEIRFSSYQGQLKSLEGDLVAIEDRMNTFKGFSDVFRNLDPLTCSNDSPSWVPQITVGLRLAAVAVRVFSESDQARVKTIKARLDEKQLELTKLNQRNEKIKSLSGNVEVDLETIHMQLKIVSQIFHQFRMDCLELQRALEIAVDPSGPKPLWRETIGFVKPTCQRLLYSMKTYANGLQTTEAKHEATLAEHIREDAISRLQSQNTSLNSRLVTILLCMVIFALGLHILIHTSPNSTALKSKSAQRIVGLPSNTHGILTGYNTISAHL
ncbi:hypothetical protein CPB86DRAFT_810638 [Serendipita vermifera]|nr:hypothetical protein CPB86DRAFT_810638 [Serendipita vermifera]